MEIINNNKTIRLTEAELHQLIAKSVEQCLNEGTFTNIAKKAGKGLGKAALAAGIGAAGLGAIDKGLENQEKYSNSINQQGMELAGPNNDEARQWCIEHNMDPDDENAMRKAYDYLYAKFNNDQEVEPMANESRKARRTISEAKLSRILRESIRKVLA